MSIESPEHPATVSGRICAGLGREMVEKLSDRGYFWGRLPHRNYYSVAIDDRLCGRIRIFHKVTEGEPMQFSKIGDDIVLKPSNRRRKQVKATVIEDSRQITRLIIQSYDKSGDPSLDLALSFTGKEIAALRHFLAGIEVVKLDDKKRSYINDSELEDVLAHVLVNGARAQKLLADHPDILAQIAQSPTLKNDLIAVGFRRAQLERFEAMLRDEGLSERQWQAFFEENTWIFGYGLSYQFLASLDQAKLEQVVAGSNVGVPGKRVDALMKTRGRISSLCFVEIKKPTTNLLAKVSDPYRPGVWAPSADLAGGIAQTQTTVHGAMKALGGEWIRADHLGAKTGEVLYNFEPRSILIAGRLSEFEDNGAVNEQKLRSFELCRRNTWRPEILTFDELLERARFIIEHSVQAPRRESLNSHEEDEPF